MKLECDICGTFTFTRDNGENVKLSHYEMEFIDIERRKNVWRYGFDRQIHDDEDFLCFDEISREEFIEMCVEDVDVERDLFGRANNPYKEPEYADIVFNVAQENDIWRD